MPRRDSLAVDPESRPLSPPSRQGSPTEGAESPFFEAGRSPGGDRSFAEGAESPFFDAGRSPGTAFELCSPQKSGMHSHLSRAACICNCSVYLSNFVAGIEGPLRWGSSPKRENVKACVMRGPTLERGSARHSAALFGVIVSLVDSALMNPA